MTWKNDRVVRIDSYYENAFRKGYCDVEGGCDEPTYRTVETSAYRYDAAGRLTVLDYEKRQYGERGTRWVESNSEDRKTRYAYDHGQLIAIGGGEMGGVKFTWKNGKPAERRFDGRGNGGAQQA